MAVRPTQQPEQSGEVDLSRATPGAATVEMKSPHKRRRGWMRVAAALALAYALVLTVIEGRSADHQFCTFLGDTVVTAKAEARAAGVAAGDRIVAVDGREFTAVHQLTRALAGLQPGHTARFTVERSGRRFEVSMRLHRRWPFAGLAGAGLGALLLLLALLSDRGAGAHAPRAFFHCALVYTVFLAGAFTVDTVVLSSPLLTGVWLLSLAFVTPVICRFAMRFPEGEARISRAVAVLLFGPQALVGTAMAALIFAYHQGWGGAQAGWIRRGMIILVAIEMLLSVGYLAAAAVIRGRRMRRLGSRLDPATRFWTVASLVGTLLPIALGAVAASVDIWGFVGGGYRIYVGAAALLGCVGVTLALTRAPFGELDRVLRRGAGYVIASAIATGVFLLAIAGAGASAALASGQGLTAALAATIATAVVFGPVRGRAQRWIDARFERDRRRARRLLAEAAHEAARTLDPRELERAVVARVRDALAADGVAIYRQTGDERFVCEAEAGQARLGVELERRDPIATRLGEALARAEVVVHKGVLLIAPLYEREGARSALVVVAPGGQLAAAGTAASAEVRELLGALAAQLSVALANARAHDALREASERLKSQAQLAEAQRREIERLKQRLEAENRVLSAELARVGGRAPVIGEGLRATYDRVERVASADATVLIRGETGTGKELVARSLHAFSGRRERTFVVVDCGALQPTLIESELFGHEKGAFTGASSQHIGAFETAHGGTLFLDEIGELPLEAQTKLLRAVEDRTVRRVGGESVVPVDVRIVAATNRDLAAEVAAGRFREDLYYRLKVVEVVVPPLRARREDIPALAEDLLREISVRRRRAAPRLMPDALALLLDHDWPGNVRELAHVLEAACAVSDGNEVHGVDLGLADEIWLRRAQRSVAEASPQAGLRGALGAIERDRIAAALREHAGNRSAVARALGLKRTTLLRLLKRHGLAA